MSNRLIVSRFDSPEASTSDDDAEWIIGSLLCDLDSFNDSILVIRDSIGLNELDDSFTKLPLEVIESVLDKVSTKRIELLQSSKDIAQRYRLSENWYIPIELAVITNRLYIPLDSKIALRLPGKDLPEKMIADVNDITQIPSKYPVIYPKYKVTINKLHTFIDENKESIEEALNSLPEKPSSRQQIHTRLQGRIAWLLRNENPEMSWTEIAEEISAVMTRNSGHRYTLGHEDARLLYQRYVEQLAKLDSI